MNIAAGDREEYWRALSSGDTQAAVDVGLRLLKAGSVLVEVLQDLVAAAQLEVGRLWAANVWSIAQEHRATSVSEDVVAALAAASTRSSPELGTALVTCVDGEWHALPSRILAAVLRHDGWRVHQLGASLPATQLGALIDEVGPDVTALSCSVATSLPRARQMIELSRSKGVPVIAGGAGFGPGGRWGLSLGANGTAASAATAIAVLRSPEWPRFTGPAPAGPASDGCDRRLAMARNRLVDAAEERLIAGWPDMRRYDANQRLRTTEDLGYIIDFLAAALLVDDPALFTGFIDWLVEILEARQVPAAAVTAGLQAIEDSVEALLGPQPRAQAFLASSLRSLGS